MKDLPVSAKVVVIGGGIVGCSTAYHLAKLGCEVVLLEQARLTSGTTFHAAGLVGQLRSNANVTQLLGYSVELYRTLEAETGLATGWKMNGGLRLACNKERWTEVKRQATTAHSFGLDMQLLTPAEALNLWPLMNTGDVIGAAFLPTDGQANPSDITQALARGARASGAEIFEDTQVLGVTVGKNGIEAVETSRGTICCEKVVCCAGQWTREFAARVGVNVPLVSVQHQYMLTGTIPGVTADLPTLRDPDRLTYYKEEVGGLVMGGYEPNPIPWAVDGIPEGFSYSLLDSDFDHFEPMLELSLGRVPALAEADIKQLTNGPESFTPDGNFILGESPELANFYIGAGFNAFGIASGGGAGMALAEWVYKGEPPYDLWSVDIRRFGRPHFDTDWVRERTLEAYTKHYTMAWPSEEHSSARPCRRSPLYQILKEQGACFGEKLGWERPNWFADLKAGELPEDIYSFEQPNWYEAVAREHKAAREAAVLIDQTSFAKYLLKGPDALQALNWISANNIDKPVGSLTYTQMLDDNGGIQCDVTVARTAVNEFYIVTGTGFAIHDYNWISRNIPETLNAQLFDVTSSTCVLSLMGPNSRDILQCVTRADISSEVFPFGSLQTIGIGGCPVNALRITYIGELGWELHFPVEYAQTVYETLMRAGRERGLVNAGYRMIESCRLEKGYRAWGSDIGPDHTPLDAGLGWAVKLKNSNTPFKGREAITRQQQAGLKKKLACFTVKDPDVVLLGRETIYRNGTRVGWLSSGGYGHHLNCAIGYGYIRNESGVTDEYIRSGSYQLEVATQLVDCQVHLKALYDNTNQRIRA
ncbi:FAD-dependent oxidoreductase [Chromatiales bacterium (ex Bugula neritina AB1)]|nr:FAD-dependent oxidoreductase [Chromatiales bacterium (ex Bugula neritina AB1)]